MSVEQLPWAVKYKPKTTAEIADNKDAIFELSRWLKSWEKGIPDKKAVFLQGPPGIGKTMSIQVLADEMGFDMLEVNASDYRTRTRLEDLIGRAATQNITIFGKRRLIVFDEMEGISGHEDQGGISAIVDIIKKTRNPIVLIASTISEENEDKFRPLRELVIIIDYKPVPTLEVYKKLEEITKHLEIKTTPEILEALAIHSEGDLRSAINDLEAISRGKKSLNISDINNLSNRDRQEYTPILINNLFAARTIQEARKIINQAHINYEDLFEWIYENIPLFLDNKEDLYNGLLALARADIYESRARKANYRLQKYMYNMMTGGVALAKTRSEGNGLKKQIINIALKHGFTQNSFIFNETATGLIIKPTKYLGDEWRKLNEAFRSQGAIYVRGTGSWSIPYIRSPQIKWRYIRTYQSRMKLKSVAIKVASKCHTSIQEAITNIIPLLHIIMKGEKEKTSTISAWLDLDDAEIDWLKN
ncbi:replication factor C large subunit [Candidatus Bathyarchaeota archaeon]|nr:replication factor C large subunit [Candidatus Bathyarchaeota archaeon]